MKAPTKKQRAAARDVLKYYMKYAFKLADKTGQERPDEWATGLEVCVALLKDDPKVLFEDYEKEFDLGR